MSSTAQLSATASVKPTSAAAQLVRMANGEYTADSVAKDPTAAAKLGLSRQKDGNYGTQSAAQLTTPPIAKSSAGVQLALTSLQVGGS